MSSPWLSGTGGDSSQQPRARCGCARCRRRSRSGCLGGLGGSTRVVSGAAAGAPAGSTTSTAAAVTLSSCCPMASRIAARRTDVRVRELSLVQVVVKKPLSPAVSRVGVMAPREGAPPSGGNALSAYDRNEVSPVRSGRLGRRRPAGLATSSPASARRVLDRPGVSPRCRRQFTLTGGPRALARHRRTSRGEEGAPCRTGKPGASAVSSVTAATDHVQ
jgi:hypothetical protein